MRRYTEMGRVVNIFKVIMSYGDVNQEILTRETIIANRNVENVFNSFY